MRRSRTGHTFEKICCAGIWSIAIRSISFDGYVCELGLGSVGNLGGNLLYTLSIMQSSIELDIPHNFP
jgi:hypothetical protein